MVLNHVAELTHLVIVGPSTFNADHLTHRNLDMIDAGIIPLTVDKAVCKAQHQQVLNCFLAKVVIDSVNGFFVKVFGKRFVHFDR